MIKLVVTDVDGTLLKEGSCTLNPDYFQIIPALKAKGIQVVMASGRSYSSMENLFAPVKDLLWYIADGGATMKTDGQLESVADFPDDWAKELWQDMSQIPHADATFCGKNMVYIPQNNSFMHGILRDGYRMNLTVQNGWQDFPPDSTGKISLFCKENVEEIGAKYLYPKWKDRLYMVIAGEWWMDCMMPQVNKGAALEKLLAKHGFTAQEIMASGDNMNDLEMLQLAGTALAVSTARDAVKSVASRVIGSYDQDAVLEEWKKLL